MHERLKGEKLYHHVPRQIVKIEKNTILLEFLLFYMGRYMYIITKCAILHRVSCFFNY